MSMQTVRQTLREALGYGPRSSLELSRELGLPAGGPSLDKFVAIEERQ